MMRRPGSPRQPARVGAAPRRSGGSVGAPRQSPRGARRAGRRRSERGGRPNASRCGRLSESISKAAGATKVRSPGGPGRGARQREGNSARGVYTASALRCLEQNHCPGRYVVTSRASMPWGASAPSAATLFIVCGQRPICFWVVQRSGPSGLGPRRRRESPRRRDAWASRHVPAEVAGHEMRGLPSRHCDARTIRSHRVGLPPPLELGEVLARGVQHGRQELQQPVALLLALLQDLLGFGETRGGRRCLLLDHLLERG